MKQASMPKAALFLSAGLLGGCPMTMEPPTTVAWKDIQSDIVAGCSTALAACHSKDATSNKLRIDTAPGQERKNYDAVVADLVNKSAPEMSRLVLRPTQADHTGGNMLPGYKSLTDVKLKRWVDWIKDGAPFEAKK